MKKFNLLGVTLLASTVLMGAGQAYAAETTPNPAEAKTPVTVELTAPTGGTVTPPLPDQGGNGGNGENNGNGGDTGSGIKGPFGIAYAPSALTSKNATVELGKAPNQQVELKSVAGGDAVTKLNVGVRDITQVAGRSWNLTAQLKWDAKELLGSKIVATGTGKVHENVDGVLFDTNKVENKVQTALEINSVAAPIMGAKDDQVMSGVYNYQFDMPKLVIENPSNVEATTYNGNIVWNLSNATM